MINFYRNFAFFLFFLLLLILHCSGFIFQFNSMHCLTFFFIIHSDFRHNISWCHFVEYWSSLTKKKLSLKMTSLKKDEMFTKFVRSIHQKVGIEFPSTDFWKDFILWVILLDKNAVSGRQQSISNHPRIWKPWKIRKKVYKAHRLAPIPIIPRLLSSWLPHLKQYKWNSV